MIKSIDENKDLLWIFLFLFILCFVVFIVSILLSFIER